MAKALTAASVAKALPDPEKRIEIGDGLTPGLRLAITPTGARSFVVRFKLHGRSGKVTLGGADRLTLAEARGLAREALSAVARGEDPAAAKRVAKAKTYAAAAEDNDLMPAVLDEFDRRHSQHLRSGADMMRRLRKELHGWRARRVQDIKRRDVIRLLDSIVDDGRPSTAVKVRLGLSKLFAWALARDLVTTSPMVGVGRPAIESSRERVLDDAELRLVWLAAGAIGRPAGVLVQLLALTGQRREEVAGLRWHELHDMDTDKAEWRLPAERAKNKRSHVIPLSKTARDIIHALPRVSGRRGEEFVLTTTGDASISGFSKAKTKLDANIAKLAVVHGDGLKVLPWRFHDLRRTAATRMADLGVAPHVVEAILNHTSGSKAGVAGIYNRAIYASEKRAALDSLAQHIESLATTPKAST